jgi:hypothetical protein
MLPEIKQGRANRGRYPIAIVGLNGAQRDGRGLRSDGASPGGRRINFGELFCRPRVSAAMRQLLAIVLTIFALTAAATGFATITYSAAADCDSACD